MTATDALSETAATGDNEDCGDEEFSLTEHLVELFEDTSNRIPNERIAQALQDLRTSIRDWTVDVLAEGNSKKIREFYGRRNVYGHVGGNGTIKARLRVESRDSFPGPVKLGNSKHFDREKRYCSLILSGIVWDLLSTMVFAEPYPVGMTSGQKARINTIETNMAERNMRLESMHSVHKTSKKKGMRIKRECCEKPLLTWSTDIKRWKAGTFTKFIRSELSKESESILLNIYKDMRNQISNWLVGPSTLKRHELAFREEIFVPAIMIHDGMQCSLSQYKIPEPFLFVEELERKVEICE
ncbi:hypothetical protein AJ79_03994 [Helicocarpus griseus UAMH5409]|uniref:Uncharacterized protein n=1 Tax=Helicocarpus griseus UAMH5409 TaxID=1447875 RepID=A0A2B7XMA2_9EURO|nr:hypothetical protein AJ79_03994 [Helicocarpus griseus UAMH5409]